MSFKKFILIPVMVAFLAFTSIVLDQLISPYMPISGNKGFSWVLFQAWAMYFVAGCTVKGGVKTLLGYVSGLIMTIIIFELAGVLGSLGFWCVPIAAFFLVIPALTLEKVEPLDFIPAIFVGAGVMVCFLIYIEGTTYTTSFITIVTYCALGLAYGFLTVKIRTVYEKMVTKQLAV